MVVYKKFVDPEPRRMQSIQCRPEEIHESWQSNKAFRLENGTVPTMKT